MDTQNPQTPPAVPGLDLPELVKKPWRQFLDTYEPLRSELFRYCRHLTRTPWDAEDLVQDALARAFVTLAQMKEPPPNPRAWLFRVASNLWIDQRRRKTATPEVEVDEAAGASSDPRTTREAAGTLLGQLGPQERAAVVLKDVFDLSLEEVAQTLSTTPGAIKAALHRARGKLVEKEEEPARVPAPGVLDTFTAAFNAADIDRLAALLLDQASVEVVGATVEYGPEAARKTVLWGMLYGVKILVDPDAPVGIDWELRKDALSSPPRIELRNHRGEWLFLHWYAHQGGDAVRAVTRLEVDGDRISALRNYFYNPEFVADICGELGVPCRSNGHRWWKEA